MRRFTKQLIIGITALCLMVYSAVQISLTVGDMVEVENAVYSASFKSLNADAYIFRDEHPVMTSGNGTACYFFADGEKVPKGAEILKIYSLDTDAAIQEEINVLGKRIAVLKKSSVAKTYSTTDLETLDSSIASKIDNIIAAVGRGSLKIASLNEDELLILMNRRSSVITASGGYDYVIDIYQNRIAELQLQLTGPSTVMAASEAGYFYSSSDGYENIFSMDLLNNLTMEEYYALESKLPDEILISRSEGKMVSSVKWYITVCLDKRTVSKLTEGKTATDSYEVKFPYSDNAVVLMKLEEIVSQTNYETAVMVFSSDSHIESFNYTRAQPVEIITEHYSGLKIPVSAIRVANGVTGVYTLDGTVVRFKTARVLYEENGYCICALPYAEDLNRLSGAVLSLYDPVITSGTGLYEGKIIK